jgi:hypothetical protein
LVRGSNPSEGTLFTQRCAELVFLRPCLVVQLEKDSALEDARRWLAQAIKGLDSQDVVINIAGPRESEAKGIYEEVGIFLESLHMTWMVDVR